MWNILKKNVKFEALYVFITDSIPSCNLTKGYCIILNNKAKTCSLKLNALFKFN